MLFNNNKNIYSKYGNKYSKLTSLGKNNVIGLGSMNYSQLESNFISFKGDFDRLRVPEFGDFLENYYRAFKDVSKINYYLDKALNSLNALKQNSYYNVALSTKEITMFRKDISEATRKFKQTSPKLNQKEIEKAVSSGISIVETSGFSGIVDYLCQSVSDLKSHLDGSNPGPVYGPNDPDNPGGAGWCATFLVTTAIVIMIVAVLVCIVAWVFYILFFWTAWKSEKVCNWSRVATAVAVTTYIVIYVLCPIFGGAKGTN